MDSVFGSDSCNFEYDWDEISVGNFRINHSNNFFVKKHPEHEKIQKQSLGTENEQFDTALEALSEANLVPRTESDEAETETGAAATAETETHANDRIDQPVDSIAVKTEDAKMSPQQNVKHTLKPARPIETNKLDKEFNVVRFAKIYDVKRKAMMNAVQQKERELRSFHSKPVPNFQAIHAAGERKRQQQAARVTCPKTPSVLRRHAESKERIQKQKEEYEASLRPKPFVSNPDPDVLRKKPFVPQIEKLHITPVPFNLQSEARLQERRQFDENFKTESERKQQEQEEQRKRDEEKVRKELRKATVFKAQPNPFK